MPGAAPAHHSTKLRRTRAFRTIVSTARAFGCGKARQTRTTTPSGEDVVVGAVRAMDGGDQPRPRRRFTIPTMPPRSLREPRRPRPGVSGVLVATVPPSWAEPVELVSPRS